MPEIAEVETVRRVLKKQILNKKIKEVKVLYQGIIENDVNDFINKLKGETFKDIERKGKWLIFLTDNYALLSHLRMEGKYFIKNSTEEIVKHEHVIFTFADNTDLRYHDTRKFGRMHLIAKKDAYNSEEISKLGPEVGDKSLTPSYLKEKLKDKKLPIKSLLLDQTIISGLGNIYVNEVLFASKINPLKEGNKITLKECENIVNTSKEIITKAIANGGTTIKSYTSSLGVTGSYQDYLKVHKKENEPCEVCHTPIKNIKVGGRSTYYCPHCQK